MCYGPGGEKAEGEPCTSHGDCASGVCLIYTDVPLNDDAVCGPMPEQTDAGCSTRVTGTLFDFATGQPVGGVNVKIVKAIEAIADPANATPLVEMPSASDGRIDMTTDKPISAPLAIISIAGGDGDYFLTATGVASPADDMSAYAVGTAIHDLWVAPTASLLEWSTALEGDAGLPDNSLPLGERGGVIGLVRDGTTGDPIAGATVVPDDENSGAVIRYLQDDGTFDDVSTGPSGIFVVLNAALMGEDFTAFLDTTELASGTAGAANGAVFSLILNADAG